MVFTNRFFALAADYSCSSHFSIFQFSAGLSIEISSKHWKQRLVGVVTDTFDVETFVDVVKTFVAVAKPFVVVEETFIIVAVESIDVAVESIVIVVGLFILDAELVVKVEDSAGFTVLVNCKILDLIIFERDDCLRRSIIGVIR